MKPHTVFVALKNLGRFIGGSDIGLIWIEKDFYGPATARQVLSCKYYKRGLKNVGMSFFKTNIPFCGLGIYHALEQETRGMKVSGGISGITQKVATLSRFLLASPEILRMLDEFMSISDKDKEEKTTHYQLKPAYTKRVLQNIEILSEGIRAHLENQFPEDSQDLRYFVSSQVVTDNIKTDILERQNSLPGFCENPFLCHFGHSLSHPHTHSQTQTFYM